MDIQIPYLNFSALLPLIIVVATGIIVMLADLFIADKRSLGWVSLIGVLLAAVVGAMQQGMP
ncbi:MAG TPA: hypothetical protein ENK24_06930, partial [Anaerolineae bacterium]|nr:hypothetical protein [Anaerolineae bacterium]